MTDAGYMPHKDRIVLVTGASRGIGYGAAKAFAKAGAHVIALARTVGGLEELDDEITRDGGTCSLIPVDLTDREALDRLPAILAERYGRVDTFIANAGLLGDLTPVSDIIPKTWNQTFAVNVHANQQLLAGLDPLLRASPAGRVVGISSSRARKFVAFWGTYSVTKAAFEALLMVYSEELKNFSVRTNIIDPGPIRTGMRAKAMPGEDPQTLATPDDLAPMILAMSSPDFTDNGTIVSFKDWQNKA